LFKKSLNLKGHTCWLSIYCYCVNCREAVVVVGPSPLQVTLRDSGPSRRRTWFHSLNKVTIVTSILTQDRLLTKHVW